MRHYRRVFAYARVSTRGQEEHGTSLEHQSEVFRAYCASHRLPAPIIAIEAESAGAEKIERRVKLASLLSEVQPGDLVLAINVSRWSRDIVYAVSSVRALVKRGIGWVSIGEHIDASTPEGDDLLGIMAWVADRERRLIREKTDGAKRRLVDMGAWIHRLTPLGYKKIGRKLIIEPDGAKKVRRIFELYIDGRSLRDIEKSVCLSHAHIGNILRARIYLGESERTDGGRIENTHEAIVNLVTWSRAQYAILSRNNRGRQARGETSTSPYLLRGIARCGSCGSAMSVTFGPKRSNGERIAYYLCARVRYGAIACDARGNIPAKDADTEAAALLLARLSELREELAQPADKPKPKRNYDAERASILRRRANLLRLVEAGEDAPDVRARLAALGAELDAVTLAEAEEARRSVGPTADERTRMLGTVDGIGLAWSRMTIAERRKVASLLASKILMRKGEPLRFVWRSVEELRL